MTWLALKALLGRVWGYLAWAATIIVVAWAYIASQRRDAVQDYKAEERERTSEAVDQRRKDEDRARATDTNALRVRMRARVNKLRSVLSSDKANSSD